jgi:hypothetical protein
MKDKRIIHIAQHLPTGAKVPMVVGKVNDKNVIEDYKEYLEHRRGFTLLMLENRWDMCRDDVLELLQKYQVPAHVNHQEIKKLQHGQSPVEAAIFFEEYIFGIEKKSKIPHSKLKSKTLETIRSH